MTQIRIRDGAFIRHFQGESVFWNIRTYGCEIIKDAEPFVRPLTTKWQSLDDVITQVATALGASPADIRQDAIDFYENLARFTFIEETGRVEDVQDRKLKRELSHPSGDDPVDGEEFPLGRFYQRFKLPANLHVDLTNGCTERCVHCYIPDYTPHYLPLELGRKVLTEFRAAQGMTVTFSGGECMMHPDFDTFLRDAHNLNLNILILSNLTLCDEQKVALLREIGPQFVNVSVYSMDPAIHDSITRLPGSWQKTMKAIKALRQAGVAVRIASPLMRLNQDSFDKLKAFAMSIQAHLIPACDIFGKMDHDCSNLSCTLNADELECALRRYRELFVQRPLAGERVTSDHKVCDIGQEHLNLDADGSYYPCDGCHGLVLGDARLMTLPEVWNGPKLNALRELKNRDFGECVTCADRRWCKVCPTRNFNETGDLRKHSSMRCRLAKVLHKVYGEE